MKRRVLPGHRRRLGAHLEDDGVNFAVFSANARRLEVCLFDPRTGDETERFDLPERTGDVWHGFVPGLGEGLHYGLRAHGPWEPAAGHRFNPQKLLLDPYARALSGPVTFHPSQVDHDPRQPGGDRDPDETDSAPFMPRCVLLAEGRRSRRRRPDRPWDETVIWEMHVRGVTMDRSGVKRRLRGTFDALGRPWLLDHLRAVGATAVELLPVHAFMDEPALVARGLSNYWGYNPVGFFAPEWRYLGPAGVRGIQAMVDRFHAAGIEVILDVVYNHTAEGDSRGPTLCYRGLDNASYYLLDPNDPRRYLNFSGCGNTLAVHRPFVLRLVLDSLRYWSEETGVDGFRFDLATALAREPNGFDHDGGFLDALRQDPVLADRKLIAEPWDLGPGGYQPGAFPPEFAEWNDDFRNAVRQFWRGDQHALPELAHVLLGSARRIDGPGRRPWRSINYVAAHDGFTLADATSYTHKRNEANGEGNRDGHDGEHGDNCGVEGPTQDPEIRARRSQRRRNILATLLLSQGTPMLLAGDEWGNSQAGNNNAYCQDNPIGWLNWADFDGELFAFVKRLAAYRRAHPCLRQGHFLHGRLRDRDGHPDVIWRQLDGSPPNWHDGNVQTISVQIRTVAGHPGMLDDCVLLAFNAGGAQWPISLPETGGGERWSRDIDTAAPRAEPQAATGGAATMIGPHSLVAFSLESGKT